MSHSKYDALLLVSFGGPEGMNEVIPFLENVLRGRNVPPERMMQVARHYELFNGVSPINEQNRRLIEAINRELQTNGIDLPIYWGNRNWHPLLPDTIARMTVDGVKRALAFVTSGYSSFSSCRQYLQNISDAQHAVGKDAPIIEKLRAFYNHPSFIEANADHLREALLQLNEANDAAATQRTSPRVEVAFTAHSIPESMAANSDYVAQLNETSRLVAEATGIEHWKLVYQSRSGSPAQPWLGPDICEHLKQLHAGGVNSVVVAPIGFVSDHMEVIYDLDVEAQQLARELGINMVRSATAGTHPAFVSMVRELILERVDDLPARFMGSRGASHNICEARCCLTPET